MKTVGFVGWRGMVGSVLMNRMKEESDFNHFNAVFFSTSQAGEKAPVVIQDHQNLILQNAWDIEYLKSLDILVTCQGSTYTKFIYPRLRASGWTGYWIDTASYLRMHQDAVIVLDPVNKLVIERGINNGVKTFVGGNCTVSLMLMALGGLFNQNLIEWIFVSTYQAASGYGAKAIKELLVQIGQVYNTISDLLDDSNIPILEIERVITEFSKTNTISTDCFKKPLIGNVLPWIGEECVEYKGQSREEWKGQLETNKILNTSKLILIDSLCVRVCSLRCHSQSLMIKLKKNLCLTEIENLIESHNNWVKVVSNQADISLGQLTPLSVSGTLRIAIGRLRKMNIGDEFISAFTVGDQLLWGAAEPIRRILNRLL
ncbi:aspartate-semialdehyde dehydrogenase [Candidatus Blochmanniella vafra str. BVAF]|uniref:Aspartate-semialdehyde dehydrogenase n=1 Tax=Blochmanniella vafra (strain BVAF) TaxID=859654 RepID=E8Q6I5_BLOVB|nr:aspartate-semialdehyde dehydrogenase [Candidatus Blochmannia vafer]ADV33954.1 aspartate-semialdehyde dehydrogenase [Candidatus Blochmannia vafer str. BVAF]